MAYLKDHDWGEEWRELAERRRPAPDEAHWDERSIDYPRSADRSPYVNEFIEGLHLEPNDTVFDMGCGNGALAIPLALDGHEVIAADFSQGMLRALAEESSELGGLPIERIHMSWTDDWEAHGVKPDMTDVAIASRSICTDDLADSLKRLDTVARKRCAITLPVGTSPRTDRRVLCELGMPVERGTAYEYAFLILASMGRLPEISYIESRKPNVFADEEDAIAAIERMVEDAARDLDCESDATGYLAKVPSWTRAHLVANPEAGQPDRKGKPQGAVMLDTPRKVTWAYIAWNVE